MPNKNAILEISEADSADSFDFDELETKLQNDLDSQLSELDFLEEDYQKIGSSENLGTTVMNVVWEQFLNQMASTAGEDFIRENRGLSLDLRDEAHIQTTDNFANGKIATHNDKIDYQERYDEWDSNFAKDEHGNRIKEIYKRRGIEKEQDALLKIKNGKGIMVPKYRKPFDENRPQGTIATPKDHTIAAAEMTRDTKANAHMDKQEIIDFANSNTNLNDLDAAANSSKQELSMTEWLDSKRNGEKPSETFHLDKAALLEKDRIAREEYEKLKEEGEQKSIEAGKQSQKEEAFRIGGKALRAVLMGLLAALVKEIIGKLILWMKSDKKNLETLLDSIKKAISSFVSKLKNHLANAGSALITTVATAIFGPIVRTIKKVWILLKQGWKSLKEAIAYLKNPESRNKPFSVLMLEVGKIVMVGLTAVSAIALGELIEKGLMAIPGAGAIFAFEIPLLGSLGSLLGIFLGGLVAGIIGAIAMNLIDRLIAKKLKAEAIKKKMEKSNEILETQAALIAVNENKLVQAKKNVATSVSNRHKAAEDVIKKALTNIYDESKAKDAIISENEKDFGELDKTLSELGV